MVTTGFTTAGMVICLGITVGILVYGAANKFKINDGEHPALWRVLLISLFVGLLIFGVHILLIAG